MNFSEIIIKTNLFAHCDAPEVWQLGVQDPATPIAEGMIFFHNYLMFFLIVIDWFKILITVLINVFLICKFQSKYIKLLFTKKVLARWARENFLLRRYYSLRCSYTKSSIKKYLQQYK